MYSRVETWRRAVAGNHESLPFLPQGIRRRVQCAILTGKLPRLVQRRQGVGAVRAIPCSSNQYDCARPSLQGTQRFSGSAWHEASAPASRCMPHPNPLSWLGQPMGILAPSMRGDHVSRNLLAFSTWLYMDARENDDARDNKERSP